MSKAACLYSITNTLNGMKYIGVTVNPQVRFRNHGYHKIKTKSAIKNAMLKHGVENFKMDILCIGSQSYCYELEAKAIEVYNTKKPNGYNICTGGRGSKGLTGEDNGMYGKTGPAHHNFGKKGYRTGMLHTEETKAKMSLARKNRKWPEEVIEKMRNTALSRTPEQKEKIRLAMLEGYKKYMRKKG